MLKLLIVPDETGYSIAEDKTVLSTEVKGGQNRFRRDVLNGAIDANVQFTCAPNEFTYLRAFYNVNSKGATAFLIDLLIETSELREYVANIKPGTWKLTKVDGNTFVVRMGLEVQPNDTGIDYAEIVNNYTPFAWTAPPPPANFGGE